MIDLTVVEVRRTWLSAAKEWSIQGSRYVHVFLLEIYGLCVHRRLSWGPFWSPFLMAGAQMTAQERPNKCYWLPHFRERRGSSQVIIVGLEILKIYKIPLLYYFFRKRFFFLKNTLPTWVSKSFYWLSDVVFLVVKKFYWDSLIYSMQ